MPIIAFMHVGEDLTLPTIMVRSVQEVMPSVPIMQLSDMDTPLVPGATEIIRMPKKAGITKLDSETTVPSGLMLFRFQLLSSVPYTDHIVLDTDCVVQRDLSHVFENKKFEVGLTKRSHIVKSTDGFDVATFMPYNTGVMFCRKPLFWRSCKRLFDTFTADLHNWWGDQIAVAKAAKRYKLLELNVDQYNYTPRSKDEDCSEKYVVHYKGKRKQWMIDRHSQLVQA